jgi:CBS domain-containing protein
MMRVHIGLTNYINWVGVGIKSILSELILNSRHITVEQLSVHNVETVEQDMPLVQCAKIMHDKKIGSLVMTELRSGLQVPVGILTDRDITVKVVAFSLDPSVFTARDIMAQPLITTQPDEELLPVLIRMRDHGVHRIPVISKDGALIGILAVDDIWEILAMETDDLERVIQARQRRMILTRPLARSSVYYPENESS